MTVLSTAFDVISIGRIGVDVYPTSVGVKLEDVTTFGKFLGGSASNVAVAAARLGLASAVVTKTGDDPFGRFARRELRRLGVSDRFVGVYGDLPTPVTFCELFPPDHFPLYFYRTPDAPDLHVTTADLSLADVVSARVYWSTLTGLSREPSRSAHLAAWHARGDAGWTIIDLDYRPGMWPGGEPEATRQAQEALRHCTVAIGNREECRVATGQSEPQAAAEALLGYGVRLAVVKLGPEGAFAMTPDQTWRIPAYPVTVVNGLGAGDAFGGALCYGLLHGWGPERALHMASAAGAYVAGRLECAVAMPTLPEVQELLAAGA